MKEISVMNPTQTDRRHFMILSDTRLNLATVESIIQKSGYQQSDADENEYVKANSRIVLYTSGSQSAEGVVGVTIIPSQEISKSVGKRANRASVLSYLFQIIFVAFLIEWLVAFLVFNTSFSYVITFLEFAIPITFFLFIFLTTSFVVYFFKFEKSAAIVNQEIVRRTLDDILPAFETLYPDIEVTRIDVLINRAEREIVKHLPEGFIDNFRQLGIHDMENRFWNF